MTNRFKTLDDVDPRGKTVLVRADLNVPMQNGSVSDSTRLERLAPTLIELADKGAKVVVLSHFGRPDGTIDIKYSLRVVAETLGQLIDRPVAFAPDSIGPVAEKAVADLAAGQIMVLENVRFYPGETKNDPAFAKALAALGDMYVNDAFSSAHRAHASTEGLAHLLPSYAGRLMQAELEALGKALGAPERPVVALVGGSKISTKLDLLQNLVAKVDVLVLGGGMANTFLAAQGVSVGKSLCEYDLLEAARAVNARAAASKCTILLPVDAVVAKVFAPGEKTSVVDVAAIPEDQMMLDIGPKSVDRIIEHLTKAKTVLWNGPMGAFETVPFEQGTMKIAKAVADLTQAGAILSVAGGGDTVAAIAMADVEPQLSYVSTAGGAFLEWLEGKELPGVAALAA